ncbi:MAG: Ig-like domain-containing protein [Chloroflexota bacterium]
MAEDMRDTAPLRDKGPNAPRNSNLPMWGGLIAAIVVIVAVTSWYLTRSNGDPNDFPPRPTGTPALSTPVDAPTITPLAGAATFTPVAGTVITGPHVLGITAGVGMRRGDVAGAAPIAVTFSEEMDQPAAQAAFSLAPTVNGDFKWQQNTLFFTPSSPLQPSTSYKVDVSQDAKTKGGSLLAAPLSANFTTAPPPSILRTLPSEGASEVPTDTIITISFNRPMIPLTALDNQPDAGKWITISPAIKGRWVWLGTAAAGFRAETGFQPATSYSVEVKSGWPDAAGVTLAQGTTFSFDTIKTAVLSVQPSNGADAVPLDAPVVVRFNMPMEHSSQSAFALRGQAGQAALQGTYQWSPDSTVMTFTAASLLAFDTRYVANFDGNVQPVNGVAAPLAGDVSTNTWDFTTTSTTRVSGHSPDTGDGPSPPSTSFGFYFNNPLAPNQQVEQYVTINPHPEGYKGQLTVSESGVLTDGVKLLPNTTYSFTLKEGLKDKWGFPVAASSWDVKIGPLPPSLAIKGGNFQPIYVDGPTRVRVETANLDTFTFHLRQLSEGDLRKFLTTPPYYQPTPTYPGTIKREWQMTVPAGQAQDGISTFYPNIALDANGDRLPSGYYLLTADAPNPYSTDYPLNSASVLIVGRTGVVTKMDGQNLLIWAADLGTGKPVPSYRLRIEQIRSDNTSSLMQTANTGQDGVARLKLDKADNVSTVAIWPDNGGDALFATTGWNYNLNPYDFGVTGTYGSTGYRADLYVDRPIYRPAQTVYYRGIYRLDDDVVYTLPPAGATVNVRAFTYGTSGGGPTNVYTGTATVSAAGTLNGSFVIPANAPVGSYTLAFSQPDLSLNDYDTGAASVSFNVEEYRKPDFQVNVTSSPERVHGDPVTATINTSYYFGGPLQNVTTTVNIQSSPYYFGWSDPVTNETYQFGEQNFLPYFNDYYRPGPNSTPEPVNSFQVLTDKDGVLNTDVTRYVTTTGGSKSVLIEGQVQDLSNQTVAANSTTVVHQGLYYVGLRTEDYIATAKQPTTITVRTVEWDAKKIHPNAPVSLNFVRRDWVAPPNYSGDWKLNEVPVGQATVTTDGDGRATYLFTPPTGGDYSVIATSTDSRGNLVKTTLQFYASDTAPGSGYVPWRYKNEQQVQLVADKEKYSIGDTARILVTSPFTQATGLLTIERGHVKRYRIVNIEGGSPTIEVPLEAGDLPNVYIGFTLLGPEQAPSGAPADWSKRTVMRQGYVNLSVDASGKELQVSIEPESKDAVRPGTTSNVKVTAKDKSGNPVVGELSLAVVDEAIYAIGGENTPNPFSTFWSERGLGVSTSTSFTSGDYSPYGYGGGDLAGRSAGGVPMPSAAPQQDASAEKSVGNAAQSPAAPQKVRSNFQDTAFWEATVTTSQDGTAIVPVTLPDNLTTWRLTTAAITNDTLAGSATNVLTVTQPLLLRPILPRFLTTGDHPHPQAIIHNNTTLELDLIVSLEVSGSVTLDKSPAAEQTLKLPAGEQRVITWNATVDKGDLANFRFWVRTTPPNGTYYLEDAVASHLPVKPFAAPEAVATSGEVSGLRADESIFIPYSVNPLLGELIVQVSPSLAAATVGALDYVKEYIYESTDQTVSRFLPLVVLEKVYNEQGLTTPYAAEIPGILDRSLRRLGELQQPDGGWAWWERGPSSWFETAYVVQGLTAALEAGYDVPADMLQRGTERLKQFQTENATQGVDESYNLNMRAYSLYVLSYAGSPTGEMKSEGMALTRQTSRISNHARAWLAMALGKMGMSTESKQVLDSLIASAKQSSTTAHWEEDKPDYWSMGTDNRATALAIDALVTLAPNDPITPKAVRWLMTAEKEGHWLSTQETSISLVALAHYIRQSKELGANYIFQVDAFGKTLGQGAANSTNITQTQTLRLPVSEMPVNSLGDLGLSRSADNGKMYYQVSLRYYVPGEGIQSRSEGLAVTRSYYKMTNGVESAEPVKEANAGDLIKVRLTIVAPETSYYVLVTDPLPAGLEGVNGSLNTTSFTERPPSPFGTTQINPGPTGKVAPGFGGYDYSPIYWRWGPFDNVEMRDDRTVLFATYMAPGTYVYEYYARATTPGQYMALPSHAELLYYPDVFGHSDGGEFTVR